MNTSKGKNPPFRKRKFLSLEEKQRHQKCAHTLRSIYEDLREENKTDLLPFYENYLEWMKLPLPLLSSPLKVKEIADRYHFHLRHAGLALKEHNLLPHIRTGDREAKLPFPNTAIYLDQVRSAYNVGSILRTVEALRIGKVYFSSMTPFIDNPKVKKTSMGSCEIVPCFSSFSLEELPRPFIGLDTGVDALNVSSFLFPESFTLILGNEEYGISEKMLSELDHIIHIPMLGAKNSINVACAFAIAAAEIQNQRQI